MSDEEKRDLEDSPQYADRDEPREEPGTQENDEAAREAELAKFEDDDEKSEDEGKDEAEDADAK